MQPVLSVLLPVRERVGSFTTGAFRQLLRPFRPAWESVDAVQGKRTVARSRRQGKNKYKAEQEVLMNRKHEARDV